jgi:threonine/homoserine/homoserine lactone efflux protein
MSAETATRSSARADYDRETMGRLFDRWPASLLRLGSIEFLALAALQVIGPTHPNTPLWFVSAVVVIAGLILPSVLICAVLARIAVRWLRRRHQP